LSLESISGAKCKCGGKLKSSLTDAEFFSFNFGIKHASVCTKCGAEYLPQEVMEEIETEVKKRALCGLERRGRVAKSGNSLVIRIPKEIAESLKIKRDLPIVIYPSEPRKLIVEVEGWSTKEDHENSECSNQLRKKLEEIVVGEGATVIIRRKERPVEEIRGVLKGSSSRFERQKEDRNPMRSEDIQEVMILGAKKIGVKVNRSLFPSRVKRLRPKLGGASAETIVRQMRKGRSGGRLSRN
jgi:antitoxin component of MazEF toxin-antitoxin module